MFIALWKLSRALRLRGRTNPLNLTARVTEFCTFYHVFAQTGMGARLLNTKRIILALPHCRGSKICAVEALESVEQRTSS